MTAVGETRIEGGCRCGNSFVVESNRPEDAYAVESLFWSLHRGEGHRGCDRAVARRIARRKAKDSTKGGM